ncbi:MAG: rhodanese-like domain-containing protein [Myxococcales bacterium]|nr:rhodanese-like domain-containing protein [Myxococcales bacterium]MCB9708856.1 rhodanese-like domain-containing protein [Myxococcales bacterium]
MSIAVNALKLLAVGAALGLVVGLVWGFPSIRDPSVDDALCAGPVHSSPSVRWITPMEARTLLNDPSVRFVDARDADAYQAGHIAGALHMTLAGGIISEKQLARLAGARTVIAYCDTLGSCSASRRLAGLLSVAGLTDVRVLEGGMPAWMDAKFPAQAGSCENC